MSTQTDSLFATAPSMSKRKQQILDALWMSAGKTRAELEAETGMKLSSVCGRCNELLKAELLYVSGERWDSQTERNVETLALK